MLYEGNVPTPKRGIAVHSANSVVVVVALYWLRYSVLYKSRVRSLRILKGSILWRAALWLARNVSVSNDDHTQLTQYEKDIFWKIDKLFTLSLAIHRVVVRCHGSSHVNI